MIKIFLTGDNHIGLKYGSHQEAETLARKRIDAFGPMVEKANDEDCDLFVIAGDLFDKTTGINKKDIRTIQEHLSHFNGTVVVLPGNHDYYDEEVKVWKDFQEEMVKHDNIMLLTSYEPKTIPGNDQDVVLYPAFCTERHSRPGENNLDWIKRETIIPDRQTYRIGLAHGAIKGVSIDQEGEYFVMSQEELEKIPMDVWLIGHTHVPFPRNLTETLQEAGKIFNAGNHVQKDVNTNTEGLCFIIEIDERKKIRAKKYVSGNVWFYRPEVHVKAGKMQEKLEQELKGIPKESVVELTVDGAVTDEEYKNRNMIYSSVLEDFLESKKPVDSKLFRLITPELINTEFAQIGLAAGLLNSLLEDPIEAQLAYDLLKKMKEAAK